ncbi:hypothetical protein SAMN05421641_12436 [Paracoccus thiocyanatus]|uniref:DUF6362 domain-containing protein n=1 Tax=Paracoccus thiocyanatus TaxID=34006 RepID=A0A1N6Y3Q9_9RHOB|nr:DUF6362 family protein [Paracoccus thiocyanatus]SIR09210.1 hypothetical protein SAMN05421641_12436 [Paracoccus thiocyanatus]
MITPREIEDRLEEAALTLRRLPNPPGSGARGYGRSWPEYIHEAKHAYGYEQATMRVIPNPQEIQHMEEALAWLALIGGDSEQAIIDNRRIVWMRAEGHRWKQICRAVGCVRSTAWRRWTAALITIANRLNRQRKSSARPRGAKSAGDNEGGKPDGGGANRPP